MKIKWYGQACFMVTSSDGVRIITDPYTPETAGYVDHTDEADIVIVSSETDSFHDRHDLIPGDNKTVINALLLAHGAGTQVEKGITFTAIEAFEMYDHPHHDPEQNAMYRMEVDGMHLGHMGDMGNPLSDAQIDFFKGVDILFALTGGVPTVELPDLMKVIEATQPKLIIPMHFRTLSYKPQEQHWISTFLDYFDEENDVDFALNYEVELTKADIPDSTRVLVLDYVRR